MEKRLMTFIAGVALSMGSALAQSQVSGTVSLQKMESLSLAHLSR